MGEEACAPTSPLLSLEDGSVLELWGSETKRLYPRKYIGFKAGATPFSIDYIALSPDVKKILRSIPLQRWKRLSITTMYTNALWQHCCFAV